MALQQATSCLDTYLNCGYQQESDQPTVIGVVFLKVFGDQIALTYVCTYVCV